MSLNVVRLDKKAKTGNRSINQLLEDELNRWNSPEWKGEMPKKAVILYLDEDVGQYVVRWAQAGLKMSECVALCDIAKGEFKKEMNY